MTTKNATSSVSSDWSVVILEFFFLPWTGNNDLLDVFFTSLSRRPLTAASSISEWREQETSDPVRSNDKGSWPETCSWKMPSPDRWEHLPEVIKLLHRLVNSSHQTLQVQFWFPGCERWKKIAVTEKLNNSTNQTYQPSHTQVSVNSFSGCKQLLSGWSIRRAAFIEPDPVWCAFRVVELRDN